MPNHTPFHEKQPTYIVQFYFGLGLHFFRHLAPASLMHINVFSWWILPSTVLKSMILWRLTHLRHPQIQPSPTAACYLPCHASPEDMTIMPSSFHGMWPLKLTSFIIPLAEDPTRLEAEFAVFFENKKAVGLGVGVSWGLSLGLCVHQQTLRLRGKIRHEAAAD